MFEDFYRFREKPFQLAPNPDFLYKSKKHRHALAYLQYGLTENVGTIVLTGEVGSGKTTTIKYILKKLGHAFDTAMIANTSVTPVQLLRMIQKEFVVSSKKMDKATVIDSLNHHFINQYAADKRSLLVIDEAQNLSPEALEEVRMLLNLQNEQSALVQILLVGQPELLHTLKKNNMRQFTQRVAVHFHLTALNQEETAVYIAHRLTRAGGRKDLFTSGAMQRVYELSSGIPRSINLVCQAALVYGFASEAKRITQDIIKQITQDKIGVGIASEPEDVTSEQTVTTVSVDSLNTAPSTAMLENLRVEVKRRILQMESDTALRNDVLLKKIKKLLALERHQYRVFKLRIGSLEEKTIQLRRLIDQLSKKQDS